MGIRHIRLGCESRRGLGTWTALFIGLALVVANPVTGLDSSSEAGATVEPVEVTGLALFAVPGGTRLDVQATGPLIWSQYRDEQGRLVLDLPNTFPSETLASPPREGLVAAVLVDQVGTAERPLTRLVVDTTQATEHELDSSGELLQLTLLPTGALAAKELPVAAEPLVVAQEAPRVVPEPVPVEPASVSAPAPVVATAPSGVLSGAGTPEEPWVGPSPDGVVASFVAAVRVTSSGVEVVGDGQFEYTTFLLSEPARFVVDLHGVTNATGIGTVPSNLSGMERVRVAQFRASPSPISRVVLDLTQPVLPAVVATPDGLRLELTAPAPAAMVEAATETELEGQVQPAPYAATAVARQPLPTEEVEPIRVANLPVESPAPEPPAYQESVPVLTYSTPSDVELYEAAPTQDDMGAVPGSRADSGRDFQARDVSGTGTQYVGQPITFTLRDADIKEVLRTFAKISGLNMVVQPGVSGSVTVELEQVPWDQALEQILKINGLGYELEGNIMRIAPRATLAQEAQQESERRRALAESVPLKTVMKRISYATASDIANLLVGGDAKILSNRGSVTTDQRTNTIIIKELPEYMDAVLSVIDQIDVPEPQVMIEARIIETTKEFSRSLGFSWGYQGVASPETGNSTGLVFPARAESEGGVELLTGGANGFIDLTLGNLLDTFNLDARLQAAEAEGLVNVLSAPKIATLNNERAEIQSGLQIPIQTVSNNTVSVQFVNATLRLAVTPHVTADGTVLMEVDVQKREPQLAFVVGGAQNAPISTKQARTLVIVRDGGTTVIGGIYKVSSDQGQDRVPGLANVPIIGHLFKNRRRNHQNDELLIFITPRVIKL